MNKIKIKKLHNGMLALDYGNQQIEIYIKQCFPWSQSGKYISLRDCDDNEVCLINNISELDQSSQDIINEQLVFSQFVLNIESIEQIKEDVELRHYNVQTAQGKRAFQTKLEDWPEIKEDGKILITDLFGDIFCIVNWKELDNNSQKELSAYVS